MKAFEYWKSEELELLFGLKRHYTPFEPLEKWLASSANIPPNHQEFLDILRQKLTIHAEYWNEDETKFFFISPLVTMIDFSSEIYNGFTQRVLTANCKDINGNTILLKGRVELVVAKGKQEPRQPFFFLHEYKPEKRRDNDPLGQLLAAMLVAQQQNPADQPLMGCFVLGRFWFFVWLQNNDYAVSAAFDATQDDLHQIYAILTQAKRHINKALGLF